MAPSTLSIRGAACIGVALLLATTSSCLFDSPDGSSEGGEFFVYPADRDGLVRAAPNSRVDIVIIERSGHPIPRAASQPSNIAVEPSELLASHTTKTSALEVQTAGQGSGRVSFTGQTSDGPVDDSVRVEVVEPDSMGLGACAAQTIQSGVSRGFYYISGFPLRVDHWKRVHEEADDIGGEPVWGYHPDDIVVRPEEAATPMPESSDHTIARFETSTEHSQFTLSPRLQREGYIEDYVFEAIQPDQITGFFVPENAGGGRAKLRVGYEVEGGGRSCAAGIRARAEVVSPRICVLTGVAGEAFVRTDDFGEFWVQFLAPGTCRISYEILDEALLAGLAAGLETTIEFETEVESKDIGSGGGGGDFD